MNRRDEAIEWHGWGQPRNGKALHVGYLPNRKSPCMYVVDGGELRVLAYFRSEEAAVEAMALIDNWLAL